MSDAPTDARRPNILFVLSDDHASHAIGAYGSVVNTTPHLDSIAGSGVRFDNLFATNSLCSPSRASLLTGTYSHENGVTTLDTFLDAAQPTFVTQLRDAGYRTGLVGKWHMGHGESDGVSHDPHGFDYWDVLVDQGEYHDPRFLSADGLRLETGYATDVITDLAIRWLDSLESRGEAAPWCLLTWHKAPHRPWEPDEAHSGRYATTPIPVPLTFGDDLGARSATARRARMSIADDLTEEDLKQSVPEGLSREDEALWKYQRYMEDYLACVAAVDDNVGRLVGWLGEHGQLDDTVVVYASDQGFFLGDHGWFDKRFMYEESIRMPFVMSYPRTVPAGTTHTGIVSNVDVAPTLLEATGLTPHPRMTGRSFWPDITGAHDPKPPHDGLYYRYWMHDDRSHHVGAHYGFRTDRYCLIYFYNDGLGVPGCSDDRYPPEWELYDLAEDPGQLWNVADDPGYASVRSDLERRLWRAQAAVGDAPHPDQPRPFGI
ncbi:MAG TPA: sulfatase [Lapillicoccus sp.]|nr:sulfatase [Lapillicoccus sp.]